MPVAIGLPITRRKFRAQSFLRKFEKPIDNNDKFNYNHQCQELIGKKIEIKIFPIYFLDIITIKTRKR
jgi:hypothetical protein